MWHNTDTGRIEFAIIVKIDPQRPLEIWRSSCQIQS